MTSIKLLRLVSVILILLYGITAGSTGLEEVKVDGPKYVRKGEDVVLSCHYDLSPRSLYAVKWYHENEEFYRYVPKEIPPKQVFAKLGVDVEVVTSDEHHITLTNTSILTSGNYKCVVSAEITFKTLFNTHELTIVVISEDSPKLFVDQVEYKQGDTIKANCSVENTSPPVNITWFVNDSSISNAVTKTFLVQNISKLITTVSTLSFDIPETSSFITLKCTGQLFNLYYMSSVMPIPLKSKSTELSMMSKSSDTLTNVNGTYKGSVNRIGILNHFLLGILQLHWWSGTLVV